MKITVLMLSFLTILSGCCTPEIKYIDRTVYIKPIAPEVKDTDIPYWDDIEIGKSVLKYQASCEAQIEKCNIDKQTIIKSIQSQLDAGK